MLQTAKPTLKDVLRATHHLDDKYFPDFESLQVLVRQLKEGGFRIALTQGVYDWFHVGHFRYLAKARSFGDVLIVGVDSDELTRKMKGADRPYDGFDERIEVLAGLNVVNVVVKRDLDQDKYDLIKLVQPDVLIMSKSTESFGEEDKRILNQYCKEIEHLEAMVPSEITSTTAKVRRIMKNGAAQLASEIETDIDDFTKRILHRIKSHLGTDSGGDNGIH